MYTGPTELFLPIGLQCEANRCIIIVNNIECNRLCFSPCQTITYLACRSNGWFLPRYTISNNIHFMQNHTYMQDGMYMTPYLQNLYKSKTR